MGSESGCSIISGGNNVSTHLILGGARSGKSAYAEKLAIMSRLPVTYLATAQIYDDEFRKRVQHHKDRRPKHWRIVESSFNLANTIKTETENGRCVIVDCLTLWLAQCLCPDCAPIEGVSWDQEKKALLDILPNLVGEVILVSNEVGMGIVPLGEINRQFQDEQGLLNQSVAKLCAHVKYFVAGLPLVLK